MMTDKECIRQVLGDLMLSPILLSRVDKYQLTLADFPDTFTKNIFLSIVNIYGDGEGARNIKPVDIENSMSFDEKAKYVFTSYHGIEYLNDALELAEPDNFDYYYKKLKKINLINDLNKAGIDTSDFYQEDLTAKDAYEINEKFDKLEIKEIIEQIKIKLLKLENEYHTDDSTESSTIEEGLEDLFESFRSGDEIGEPLQGLLFNEIVSGAVPGRLYIRSAQSGLGKTRNAVSDACKLAFPIRFEWTTNKWELTGSNQKILFIATEQNKQEIQKMVLSYLSGINESRFKYGEFNRREIEVIEQTKQVIAQFKDNFIITRMPNPTIELINLIVREHCIMYGCIYVFYDYIFISPSIIQEFKGVNLRNDEILLMMGNALKNLAVELNVFVMTSTQVNAKADDNDEIRNESALAGGRATINKADVGVIMARPTKQEIDYLEEIQLIKGTIPNVVTDIFKVRSGQWTQVRIWSYMDLGVLRKKDLFVTDAQFQPVNVITHQQLYSWEDEEFSGIIKDMTVALNDRLQSIS